MSEELNQDQLQEALEIFEIQLPLTPEGLNQRYRKLLWMWHPHRYANLTNNPQKYMEMYKKGETRTKEVHAAFKTLKNWLENSADPQTHLEKPSSSPPENS